MLFWSKYNGEGLRLIHGRQVDDELFLLRIGFNNHALHPVKPDFRNGGGCGLRRRCSCAEQYQQTG